MSAEHTALHLIPNLQSSNEGKIVCSSAIATKDRVIQLLFEAEGKVDQELWILSAEVDRNLRLGKNVQRILWFAVSDNFCVSNLISFHRKAMKVEGLPQAH